MKKTAMALLLMSALSQMAFTAVSGTDEVYTLQSPELMGGGSGLTSSVPIQGDVLNPAASGDNQRVTFDVNYAGLYGLASSDGYKGHLFNMGLSVPSRYGVFTGSGQFMTSSLSSFWLPTMGELRFSYAKDVYRDFLLGVGLTSGVGTYDGSTVDWTLGLDLGLVHKLDRLGPLSDFKWGLALRKLGKWMSVPTTAQQPGAFFTPAVGAEFNFFKEKSWEWGLNSELSFPWFQDARLTLGSTFRWGPLTLKSAMQADIADLVANQNYRSLVPTLGVSFHFLTDLGEGASLLGNLSEKYRRNEIRPQAAFSWLKSDTLAFSTGLNVPLGVIDRLPPEITVGYPPVQYLSPNNDGKKDALLFSLKITDQRFVKTYALEISNSENQVVRRIRNKDERPENEDLQSFFSRLTEVKAGIMIPETLRWGGNSDAGSVVPDGRYTFVVTSSDDNLNQSQVGPFELFVDNTPPAIDLKPLSGPELIFSPDGDGNKDTITFKQSGSLEDLWALQVFNTFGTEVFRSEQKQTELASLVWDGKDAQGQYVPDGVYSYRVSATDRADNSSFQTIENIIVNTQLTPVVLTLNFPEFSPNGDGVKDQIDLIPAIPIKDGIRSWTVDILGKGSSVVRSLSDASGGLPPAILPFDGKNDKGQILPEGEYKARLTVSYWKGNNPTNTSPPFILDITKPEVSVLIDGVATFSPDGDGNRDRLPIRQEASTETTWEASILSVSSAASAVKTFRWSGVPDAITDWNGLSDAGQLQPDGEYYYTIGATDAAGNHGQARSDAFVLDTRKRDAILTAELGAFSPNADGVKDKIKLFPRTNITEGLSRYEVRITNAAQQVSRTWKGLQTLPEFFLWDGLGDDGRRVPEGPYHGTLSIAYQSGSEASARSSDFNLDVSYPTVEISAPYALFSPNGDGRKDELPLSHKTTKEIPWTGTIMNTEGRTVRSFGWNKTIPDLVWNGTDENGNILPDGQYAYRVSGEDPAGNRAVAELAGLTIDNRRSELFLTMDKQAFAPGKAFPLGSMRFEVISELKTGMLGWKLSLIHKEKGLLQELSGAGQVPDRIVWDGMGRDGRVNEGEYKAVLHAVYEKGDEPQAETPGFLADISPPEVRIAFSPEFFSPDNDGFNDELTIDIEVRDLVGVSKWSMEILDPEGNPFNKFEGTGLPSSQIIWDGQGINGELVQAASDYKTRFTAVDKLGNKREVEGVIPVDVLVIRDGERLKMQIPSITFPANKAELLTDGSEASLKNQQILGRLVQILSRFSKHKIRIEGHAVNLSGTAQEEEKELKPLSLARAATVRDALAKLGIDPARITVDGKGGLEPLVPHGDAANRWKNRRVDFILVRQ